MFAVAAVAADCWLCVLLAAPRRPLPGAEVEEAVAVYLLGRWQRLRLVAILTTLAAILAAILALPSGPIADMRAPPVAQRLCTYPPTGFPRCYAQQYDGTWIEEELQDGGTWIALGIVKAPPPPAMCADDDALMCAGAR